ncbi:hypothetical protein DN752_10605 [Echinicola strongylocentroti]|uniref:Uncharacterized protein n=1 Tax=Echinicola strongylocentroti TaxID=1795355 RepID=A0A2Z4IIH8_9BACT|nr:hypothetical protein [Echinicola strongylocentroti]AWW30539.1 hypothetical protein DN752_10605 [Echinicola strongylocentroti]
MGSIFFPWAAIFLAKFLGVFHPFTFVTFLLQVKKVTKKPRRCASIGLKLKPALMQANSSFLAANILLGQHFVKQACLFAHPLFNFLTPNTCKADPINKFLMDKLSSLFHVVVYFLK